MFDDNPFAGGAGDLTRPGPDGGRFTNPLVTWATSEASPSGLAVAGDTIYGAALRGERLWTLPLADGQVGTPTAQLQGTYGRLRTVQTAPDGSLWLITSNTDGRGTPTAEDDQVLRFQLG